MQLSDRRRRAIQRASMIFLFVTLLFLLLLFGLNRHVARTADAFIYQTAPQTPPAYAALILGAKVHANGRLSDVLQDRVATGWELYRLGKVKKLLLSGDHGQKNYDEVNAMRNELLKRGVPAQDMFMDHAGFNTYSSMYRARDVFQVQDVIIVTQRFHLERAVYLARALGLNAVGVVADQRIYTQTGRLKWAIRERIARMKAVADVMLHVKPKYVGPAIPITGDGTQTVG